MIVGGARSVLAGGLVLLLCGLAAAQDEPPRALIGIWQGKVDAGTDPERTLVIKSVTRSGEHWVADIHYGTTGKALSPLPARIEMSAGVPVLTFTMSADSKAELRLFAARELHGWLGVRVARESSWVRRQMRLEKTSDQPR